MLYEIIIPALTLIIGLLLGFVYGRVPAYKKWRNGYAARLKLRMAPIVEALTTELDRHIAAEESLLPKLGASLSDDPSATLPLLRETKISLLSYCHGRIKGGSMCRKDVFQCQKCGQSGCDYWLSNNECSSQRFRGGECMSCGSTVKRQLIVDTYQDEINSPTV